MAESDTHPQLRQIDVAATLLADGIPVRIEALGLSMRPFIRNGDILTINPMKGNHPRPVDVVLYRSPHRRPMVHRVLKIRHLPADPLVLIRGDASTGQPDAVRPHDILGYVATLTRNGRTTATDTPIRRTAATAWRWLFPIRWLVRRILGSTSPD